MTKGPDTSDQLADREAFWTPSAAQIHAGVAALISSARVSHNLAGSEAEEVVRDVLEDALSYKAYETNDTSLA